MSATPPVPKLEKGWVASPACLKWVRIASSSLGLLASYFLVIFLPVRRMPLYLLPSAVVLFLVIYGLIRCSGPRQLLSQTSLQGITVTSLTTLLCLLAVDTGFAFYGNSFKNTGQDFISDYYRLTDQALWEGEVHPRSFYPTEKNFFLHKPNVTISADVYGRAYYPALLKSPTMVHSVLELHHVSYIIDQHGFRETTSVEQAHIFALGDSLALAQHVEQEKTWEKLLEKSIGQPVYNLGVSNTGPKQQLLMLEYLFQTEGDSFRPRHVLWMISEGSDLEDSYANLRPIHPPSRLNSAFRGTILEALAFVPAVVQSESVIHQVMVGRLTLALPTKRTAGGDPYLVDGIRLDWPLYHSARFGYRCFEPRFLERATKTESYVLEHPHRPLLDQTFGEMSALSKKHGFDVTVIPAPSDSRLYGEYFENFPPLSKEPYFINYVLRLSRSLGFNTLDLYSLLKPYARNELLHFRDDVHWNERGNAVVAQIIAEHVSNIQPASKAVALGGIPAVTSARK